MVNNKDKWKILNDIKKDTHNNIPKNLLINKFIEYDWQCHDEGEPWDIIQILSIIKETLDETYKVEHLKLSGEDAINFIRNLNNPEVIEHFQNKLKEINESMTISKKGDILEVDIPGLDLSFLDK